MSEHQQPIRSESRLYRGEVTGELDVLLAFSVVSPRRERTMCLLERVWAHHQPIVHWSEWQLLALLKKKQIELQSLRCLLGEIQCPCKFPTLVFFCRLELIGGLSFYLKWAPDLFFILLERQPKSQVNKQTPWLRKTTLLAKEE